MRPLAGAPGAGAGLGRTHPRARRRRRRSSAWSTPASGRRARCSPRSPGSVVRRATSTASASAATTGRADDCNRKLVGARWFVAGFGEDNVRSSSSLSPLDDSGHGTQMASIAAGNAGVSVQVPGQRLGPYGGDRAPGPDRGLQGLLDRRPTPPTTAAPPPTWSPRSTGRPATASTCSTSPSAARPTVDTVERALLGAAEKDIVVVAAAGNRGRAMYAAHPSPVGDVGRRHHRRRTAGQRRPARRQPSSTGAMASSRAAGPARLVVGREGAGARRLAGVGPDLPPRLARRLPHRGRHRALRARRHRPGRQVAGRRPGRRRRHGPGQRRAAAGSSPTCTASRPSTCDADAARSAADVGGPAPAAAGSP